MFIPKQFAGLAKMTDPHSVRWTLGAVHLERRQDNGQAVAVATDSRRMLVCEWDDSIQPQKTINAFETAGANSDRVADFQTEVPADAWQSILKTIPATKAHPHRAAHLCEPSANGTLQLTAFGKGCGIVRNQTPAAEGRYPRWRDCFPTETPAAVVCVDARMMGEALIAMADCLGKDDREGKPVRVDLRVIDASHGIVLEGENAGIKARGIVMPYSR